VLVELLSLGVTAEVLRATSQKARWMDRFTA